MTLRSLYVVLRGFAALVALCLASHSWGAEPALEEAKTLLRQGQYQPALEKVDQFLATKPKDVQGRFTKGIILTEMNRPNDAITVYQKITEDYPELPEPYNNLAVIYASQRQYEKAKAALEMAIRTHPTYATAHENLGDVYAKLASQAYDKALQLDSGNTQAQSKLAMIRELMGAGSVPAGTRVAAKAPVAPVTPVQTPVPAAKAPAPVVAAAPTAVAPAKPVAAASTAATAKVKPTGKVEPVPVEAEPKKPESGKPATQSADAAEAEARKAVLGWASSWSRKDVRGYLNHYARDFRTPGGVPRQEWEDERKSRLNKPGPIKVSVDALRIEIAGDRATAHFRQGYDSANLKSSSTKTLVLVRRDGRWLIQQERIGG